MLLRTLFSTASPPPVTHQHAVLRETILVEPAVPRSAGNGCLPGVVVADQPRCHESAIGPPTNCDARVVDEPLLLERGNSGHDVATAAIGSIAHDGALVLVAQVIASTQSRQLRRTSTRFCTKYRKRRKLLKTKHREISTRGHNHLHCIYESLSCAPLFGAGTHMQTPKRGSPI